MSLLDNMKGLLAQYASGSAPAGEAAAHFEQVAQAADSSTVAQGIAAAMRSDQTPPFAQLVSQLFASASPEQKAATVNALLGALPPAQRNTLTTWLPDLANASSVTPAQASALPPAAVQSIAQHAEQHDGGIVDRMSALYAAHPTLVKTLGSAVVMIAMKKIAERHA